MNGTANIQDIKARAIAELYSSLGIQRDPFKDYATARNGQDVPLVKGAYYRLVQRGIEIVDSRGAVPDELVRKINSSLQ